VTTVREGRWQIAMLSMHSNPVGELGTKDTGGMSVYIRELARELGKRGHRIDIYSRPRNGDHQPVMPLYENVRLVHIGQAIDANLSRLALYPYLSEFFQSLEKFRTSEKLEYGLIHSHYWLSGRVGQWAQNLWNRPHMIMFHTLGEAKNQSGVGPQEPPLRLAIEKELVGTCDRILAPTRTEHKMLTGYYACPTEKIGFVPCGVDLELFQPAPKLSARKQLGLAPDEVILLNVGRFEPLKGIDILLEAMRYFRRRERVRLLVVGGDGEKSPETQHLRQKINQLGITEKVKFAGRIEQRHLPPYYQAADVLVITSHYESFGLVGLEALACGRPVVSTPVGAMEQLIQQGRSGCVVTAIRPESIAAGIRSTISNASLSSPAEIRNSVSAYSWSNIAAAVEAEYATLLAQMPLRAEGLMAAEASG